MDRKAWEGHKEIEKASKSRGSLGGGGAPYVYIYIYTHRYTDIDREALSSTRVFSEAFQRAP